jgi:hypothetical protein
LYLGLNFNAPVQALDGGSRIGVGAQRDDGNVPRGAIFPSKYGRFFLVLAGFFKLPLLGLVSSVKLRHNLLVRSLALSFFAGDSA